MAITSRTTNPGALRTRRAFVAAGLAASAASALPGQFAAAAPKPIRFGIFGNAQKLAARARAIARFNELFPDQPVLFEGIPSDLWPDKIAAMVAGGNAPDVFTLNQGETQQYAARRALAPLDEFAPDVLRTGLFDKAVLDLGRVNGKLYGVPVAVSIFGMGYNQSALKRIGMPAPPDVWSYDEFARFCADIHKADKSLYGSHDTGGRLILFQIYLSSLGRPMFDGQGLAIKADNVAEWFDFWDRMRATGGVVPPDLQASFVETQWPNSPLVKGTAVFAAMASQDLSGGYQALTKDTLSMTTPPSARPGGKPGYFPQPTSSICVYARSANKAASARVLDWFVSDPESAKLLGLVSGPPASKPALQTVVGLSDISAVDRTVLEYTKSALARAEPAPDMPLGFRSLTELLRRTNESIGFKRLSVKEGAIQFVNQATALLKRA